MNYNDEIIEDIVELDIYVVTDKGKRKIKLYDFINMRNPTISVVSDDTKEPRREFNLNMRFDNCKMKIKC